MGIGVAVFMNGEYSEENSLAIFVDGPTCPVRGTNNTAEWLACIYAMKTGKSLRKVYPEATFTIYSDSQIIANQFNGIYAIKEKDFEQFYIEAHRDAMHIGGANKIIWVKRELNKEADKLSKIGRIEMNPKNLVTDEK